MLVAALVVLVGAGAGSARATIGAGDLVVNSPFSAKWVNGGAKDIFVSSKPTDGTNRLVIDVLMDQTSIAHVDCSCTSYGDSTGPAGMRKIASYDTGALADGSAHTLTVRLTKYPRGEQTTATYPFNVDLTPPSADPDGELRWAADGYLKAIDQYRIVAGADDGLSGVARAGWNATDARGGTRIAPDAVTCTADPCPWHVEPIVKRDLTEGRQTIYETVTDRAGNVGRSDSWTVSIDKTPPPAPVGLQVPRDGDTGEAFVTWDDAGDPALQDGSPGSGIASYQYRFQVNGGSWSAVTSTEDEYFSLGSQPAGTNVAVEVTAVDAAGNAGPTASLSGVATDATVSASTEFEFLTEEGTSSAQARPQQEEPKKLLVKCAIYTATQDDNQPVITDLAGESNIEVVGAIRGRCIPADPVDPESQAAAAAARLTVQACLQVERSGGSWDSIKCDHPISKTGPTSLDPLNYALAQICEPGSPRYRVRATSTVTGAGTPDRKVAATKPRSLPCNEAGAWRRIATRGGSAGTALGRDLKSTGIDPLPQGDSTLGGNGGWEAHHIVPAGEGRGTEDPLGTTGSLAQRYAYDCGIKPNSGPNGVWLRGPSLASGTSSYAKLDAAGKNRALHRSGSGVHTSANKQNYYTYVANQLSVYVNEATDECTSPSGAVNALTQIRSLLKNGTVPG